MRDDRLKVLRSVLYRLKQAYGQPVTVAYQTSSAVNLATGLKTVARDGLTVPRAVVFPAQAAKQFKYDIGYLRANSNFTYGGLYGEGTRQVLLDHRDLPADCTISVTDALYLVFKGKRYDIKSVDTLEIGAYYLVVQETKGAVLENVITVQVHDFLGLTDQFTGGIA